MIIRNNIHIGYLICVELMQNFGNKHFTYYTFIIHISGNKILGTYHIDIIQTLYRYRRL
jgi:predicted metalloprotease with PDZ domain